MMNYKKGILLIIIGLIFSINVYAKESVFDPTVNIEYEDNMVNIILGYKGENIDAVGNKIGYLKDELTYIGVTPLEDFNIESSKKNVENEFDIIEFNTKSPSLYQDTNYVLLTFEIDKNVKESTLYIYDYLASSSYDYYKYRSNGVNITFSKNESGYTHIIRNNTKSTKVIYIFKKYVKYALISIFGIVLFIVLIIILLPNKRKKENRKNKLNNKIEKSNNYIVKNNKFDENMMEDLSDNNGVLKEENNTSKNVVPEEGLISINKVDFNEVQDEKNDDL